MSEGCFVAKKEADSRFHFGMEMLKTSYGLGIVFRCLDEKRAQSKLPGPQAQKLGCAYNLDRNSHNKHS